jgi:hypothetical protein
LLDPHFLHLAMILLPPVQSLEKHDAKTEHQDGYSPYDDNETKH